MMLMGHLAADPELRGTKSGHSVANFPLATNRFSKSKDGEVKDIVDFHKVIAWNGLAEICDKYLAKGSAVFIEGRLINRSFEDSDGGKHFRTEIIADSLHILTWKKNNEGVEDLGLKSISGDEGDIEVVEE